MKLILAQYLRSLKERDEFDKLLPDLLMVMGYVPISKPQTGIRQFGVDLAAVGLAPEDGIQELLLLVIKRGDIGRSEWDSGPQSVRQSLNEVIDVYLKTHIEPAHESIRKRIVLATTGDLKQDTQINWDNYAKEHSMRALFSFWGGDMIASLIEQHMLNENIFNTEDRAHLRKALALAGELDYDQKDLYRLFHRQLRLTDEGERVDTGNGSQYIVKALRVINLSAQVFSRWSEEEGNLKQALVASERALLWSWHRIQQEEENDRRRYYQEFSDLFQSYNAVAHRYFEKLQGHLYVQDGLSGYCRENAEFSLVVFEQIGLLASIGLCRILAAAGDEETRKTELNNAAIVADGLTALLKDNPVSGSPRLDIQIVDIVLGMLLLVLTGNISQAQNWLAELVKRVDYTFKRKRDFPICTDSTDDLVKATVFGDDEIATRLMSTSWLLPTIAGWSVILERHDLYDVLTKNSKKDYAEICLQLWHPTNQDFFKHLYYWTAYHHCGESEAPIVLPDDAREFRARMEGILKSERHNVIASSTAGKAGISAIDLIACRHFRTPVAPFFWYKLLQLKELNSMEESSEAPPLT
ncbi:MAG: hypothetical protein HZB61_06020 [Nitrospirae bacterium]|nr:hypothetical protein [Nitrospirota bacterium]